MRLGDVGLRTCGSGFRVQDLGIKVPDLGVRGVLAIREVHDEEAPGILMQSYNLVNPKKRAAS